MSKQIKYIYEFGEFRLETAERLLLHKGKPISPTPRPSTQVDHIK